MIGKPPRNDTLAAAFPELDAVPPRQTWIQHPMAISKKAYRSDRNVFTTTRGNVIDESCSRTVFERSPARIIAIVASPANVAASAVRARCRNPLQTTSTATRRLNGRDSSRCVNSAPYSARQRAG